MRKFIFLLLISLLNLLPCISSAEQKLHVTFINPGFSDAGNPSGAFWASVASVMRAAAEDLNIDLEILYSKRNHLKMVRLGKEVVSRKNPPDYLIVVNEKLSAEQMVIDADKAGVKVFVMLNRFEGEQRKRMGQPRGKYPNWIGSLIPDNHYAGYLIAKVLIENALQAGITSPDGRLHMLGLSGDYITQASVERVNGLKLAAAEHPDVDLQQIIPCNWSKDQARSKIIAALSRYPNIDLVWGANDPIALGAMEGAIAMGKKPGENIFFGGLNWDPSGLEKIKSGEMVTSVGGHFMTGGWALVLLYDYHHGRDFAEEGRQLQFKIFGALENKNFHLFHDFYGDRNWAKIHFTRYSKVSNLRLQQYQFDIETLLKVKD